MPKSSVVVLASKDPFVSRPEGGMRGKNFMQN